MNVLLSAFDERGHENARTSVLPGCTVVLTCSLEVGAVELVVQPRPVIVIGDGLICPNSTASIPFVLRIGVVHKKPDCARHDVETAADPLPNSPSE